MNMSDNEIIQSYSGAVNKFKQVGILADLNCVSNKEMAEWLADHGQEVDGRYLPKKKPEEPASQKAKRDAGKPRLSLVPTQIIFDIAAIREYGNGKYPDGGPDNWKSVEIDRYRDAAFRHLLSYIQDPAGVDEESGLPHLWHLACNVAFLCELERRA